MFRNVVIMLIAPNIELAPDTCNAKIAKSILIPLSVELSGGYITQPTPAPVCPLPPGANKLQIASVTPAT